MKSLAWIVVALLLACPAVGQHAVGDREQWQPQSGDEGAAPDARLAQRVEIEIIGRAAVPALEMLTEATGVSLQVAPEDLDTVGERKLTIISNGLDLKSIMVQIPEALQECHWDIDNGGEGSMYLLHRNASLEASVKKASQARLLARVRQPRFECLEDARRALAMSPEELEELEKTDVFLARAAEHPLTRALMDSYTSLPEEHLSELLDTGRLELGYKEASPALQNAVRRSAELLRSWLLWVESLPAEERPPGWDQAAAADWRHKLNGFAEQLAVGSGHDVAVHIDHLSGRDVQPPTLRWNAGDITSGSSGSVWLVPPRRPTDPLSAYVCEWLLVATGDSAGDARGAVRRAQEEWQRLSEFDRHEWDESDCPESSDPRLHMQVSFPWRAAGDQRRVIVTDIQQIVAEKTGLSVVADYFTEQAALVPSDELPQEAAIWRLLCLLGAYGSYHWSQHGDCLVFHHTSWYHAVRSELPESLIAMYRGRLVSQGRFTLDDLVDLALEMEDRPFAREDRSFRLPADLLDAGAFLAADSRTRVHLVLYGALTPAERAAARSPEGLAFAELPPSRRSELTDCVVLPRTLTRRLREPVEQVARGMTFFLVESTGEVPDGPFVRYEFRLVPAQETSLPEDYWTAAVRLPERPAESAQETAGPGS